MTETVEAFGLSTQWSRYRSKDAPHLSRFREGEALAGDGRRILCLFPVHRESNALPGSRRLSRRDRPSSAERSVFWLTTGSDALSNSAEAAGLLKSCLRFRTEFNLSK